MVGLAESAAVEVPATPGTPRQIRVLPPLLVNQIAAGEVVERPASVVKELIDNALDAGATRITLEIEAGGIELVRVIDDGSGVPLAEAPLMLSPHATSKIARAEDLDSIGTMGFRGEALASITSVARVVVRSRTRAEAGAWTIEAEGDRISAPRPDAGPVGTSVTVRNLFFNTPARRKFLRTPPTEQQRCVEACRDLACAHPGVAFKVVCDGRATLDLAARDGPRERIIDVLGRELEPQLLEASADRFDDSRGVLLWGLVGLPAIARATSAAQKFFINGRPVRDRTIQHALQEAYRGLMPHDRKPTAVLLLDMAPAGVDVNVHPTKAEVRFRDSGLVHSVVLRAVRDALRAADLTPMIGGGFESGLGELRGGGFAPGAPGAILPGSAAIMPGAPDPSVRARSGSDGSKSPTPTTLGAAAGAFVEFFRRAANPGGAPRFDYDALRRAVEADRESAALGAARAEAGKPAAGSGSEPGVPSLPLRALTEASLTDGITPPSRVLQVHNSFVVTQDEHGIVIVDQHALHERVMFEAIMERVRAASTGSGSLETQRLLTPAIVPAAPAQIDLLEQMRPMLNRLGIDAQAIGPTSIAAHSFPTLLFERGVDAGEFLASLLERAETDGLPASEEGAIHEIVDMMACKAAVKAGDRMSEPELAALLDLRESVERSSSCPHGRPTSIRLTVRELEKRFGRT